MSAAQILQLPVIQITLPILVGFAVMTLWQNKRIDDLRDAVNRGFDRIDAELKLIRVTLTETDRRITRLEERTPPLVHQR